MKRGNLYVVQSYSTRWCYLSKNTHSVVIFSKAQGTSRETVTGGRILN